MHSSNPIGGYFELELPHPRPWLHDKAILLSSGRAALEYVIRAIKPTLIYIPRFTCDVVLEPIKNTGTAYRFYSITPQLEIADDISPSHGELLLYTNYFGVMGTYCRKLAKKLGGKLVLDFSQALLTPPEFGAHTFYSPRKFVGVPDGGCLYTDATLPAKLPCDSSWDRYSHLIGRRDLGAEAAYESFKANDAALIGGGLKRMSMSTERLLSSIDFDRVLRTRLENFMILHEALGVKNNLNIDVAAVFGPMVYPFLCNYSDLRTKLANEKIYTAMYWPNVLNWCSENDIEWQITTNLLCLPIDQRYGISEMKRIIEAVCFNLPPENSLN